MFDPNTKILVVDDMMTMRKLVTKSLKEIGFKDISEAKDGAEAWEALSNANPPFGLVVSDWNMPNSSGMDLLKRVRSDSKYGTLPFVLVTAENEKHQVMEAIQAGVSNYVTKPFKTEDLRTKLEAVHRKFAA
jgi:two-component system chemotaxis response regulator CheY